MVTFKGNNLTFYQLGSPPIVEVLIGLDSTDLHYSFRNVQCELGQPIARLTPLHRENNVHIYMSYFHVFSFSTLHMCYFILHNVLYLAYHNVLYQVC